MNFLMKNYFENLPKYVFKTVSKKYAINHLKQWKKSSDCQLPSGNVKKVFKWHRNREKEEEEEEKI